MHWLDSPGATRRETTSTLPWQTTRRAALSAATAALLLKPHHSIRTTAITMCHMCLDTRAHTHGGHRSQRACVRACPPVAPADGGCDGGVLMPPHEPRLRPACFGDWSRVDEREGGSDGSWDGGNDAQLSATSTGDISPVPCPFGDLGALRPCLESPLLPSALGEWTSRTMLTTS